MMVGLKEPLALWSPQSGVAGMGQEEGAGGAVARLQPHTDGEVGSRSVKTCMSCTALDSILAVQT